MGKPNHEPFLKRYVLGKISDKDRCDYSVTYEIVLAENIQRKVYVNQDESPTDLQILSK